jgi:hypothetical protein
MTQFFDVNRDGVAETPMDGNTDGYAETLAEDTDGDGYAETLLIDGNADGYAETVAVDTDHDGYAETTMTDANLDGYADAPPAPSDPTTVNQTDDPNADWITSPPVDSTADPQERAEFENAMEHPQFRESWLHAYDGNQQVVHEILDSMNPPDADDDGTSDAVDLEPYNQFEH